jgi:hypothetical protein
MSSQRALFTVAPSGVHLFFENFPNWTSQYFHLMDDYRNCTISKWSDHWWGNSLRNCKHFHMEKYQCHFFRCKTLQTDMYLLSCLDSGEVFVASEC